MSTNLQFTLSLSALLQGLLILAMGIIGFFIRREIVKFDESRKLQVDSNKKMYQILDELKAQRVECIKLFATKESVEECVHRINQHERELGELRGLVTVKLASNKDHSNA